MEKKERGMLLLQQSVLLLLLPSVTCQHLPLFGAWKCRLFRLLENCGSDSDVGLEIIADGVVAKSVVATCVA